ncbi:copper chaperone [Halomicrobium zhouii]|uniref:Copper chaperone n=1 Tax=Halomicrobium zhouii TaxID=767519 RepID=A0A1I6LBI3_9EURY|nr:heavy metal-associated domain-containing protein [Halomicrobium zhouii]SFS00560.1 copper chaperone [Halomicrobium zhouii]
MSEFILEVDGMTCINCEQLVEDEVADLCSVDGVSANATKGCVRVEGSPSAVRSVQEAIDDLGFDVEQ